jgi:acetyltransferase-like isoleucine patch superfamily enzyme
MTTNLFQAKIFFWKLVKKFQRNIFHTNRNISQKPYVDSDSKLGDYVALFGNAKVIRSNISAFTYVQPNTVIFNCNIGKFCSIAEGVRIGLAEHPLHLISTSPIFYDDSQDLPKFLVAKSSNFGKETITEVGSDVWIGQNAIIKSGVCIGSGSVIGAGSIVTRDVPPYAIYAGNPAKLIRMRFPDKVIDTLLNSRWWELDHEVLAEYSSFFENPLAFVRILKKNGHLK